MKKKLVHCFSHRFPDGKLLNLEVDFNKKVPSIRVLSPCKSHFKFAEEYNKWVSEVVVPEIGRIATVDQLLGLAAIGYYELKH